MLDKKLVHVVYSKLDRDVLVIAMPAEKYAIYILHTYVEQLKEVCTIGFVTPCSLRRIMKMSRPV